MIADETSRASREGFVKLTQEQRAVVEAPGDAHLTVLAVAGSGKTTTMVHRLAELALRGVKPAHMRAVMFNKAAQKAFESRLAATGIDIRELRVQTWHALGFGIVRHLESVGAVARMTLITDGGEILRIVGDCIREEFAERNEHPDEDDGRDTESCLEAIREWKSMLVAPKRAGHATDEFLAAVYGRFEKRRKTQGFRTFDDLIADAVSALSESDSRHGLADRFEHLVLDEFQDVDHAQFRLLELLAGTRARVTVVGDDDQTIHEWRGARSAFIRGEFAKRITTHRHLAFTLSTSFRFGPALAEAAERAIAPGQGRVAKRIIASDPEQDSQLVVVTESGDTPAALDPLVMKLRELLDDATPARDIVVLGRSWAQLLAMEWRMLAARIPFAMDEHAAFAGDPSLSLLLHYVRAAQGVRMPINDDLAKTILRIVNRPFRGVSRQGIERLVRDAQREHLSIADICFGEDLHKIAGFHGGARIELKALGGVLLKAMRRDGGDAGAADAIRILRNEIDFKEALSAHRSEASVAECLRAFEVLEDFARASRCRLAELEAQLASVDPSQGEPKERCIRVTTIHRVKGLEWDFVFIPECDEGWMPLPGDEVSGCFDKESTQATLGRSPAIESERRLFYVGITRARTTCFVSCGNEEERSRFLRDALAKPEKNAKLVKVARAAKR
jgi:DNA helicase-2/ATP-dependent DNA helicase PcrA